LILLIEALVNFPPCMGSCPVVNSQPSQMFDRGAPFVKLAWHLPPLIDVDSREVRESKAARSCWCTTTVMMVSATSYAGVTSGVLGTFTNPPAASDFSRYYFSPFRAAGDHCATTASWEHNHVQSTRNFNENPPARYHLL